MTIKVYDIDTEVKQRHISKEEYYENIENILDKINDQVPSNHVLYELSDERAADDNNPITLINDKYFGEDNLDDESLNEITNDIANKLLDAELVTTSTGSTRRNLNITQGILIVKTQQNYVILLKLEESSNVNPTTFAIEKSLSLDNQYFKYAIVEQENFKEVTVVDRSSIIAKYWAEVFLGLSPARTPKSNTKELIRLLKNKELFNKDIEWEENEVENLENKLINFLYENHNFTKEVFFRTLDYDIDREDINSQNIFSENAIEKIDSEFNVSKKALNDEYRKTLSISDSVTLIIENIKVEKLKQTFELDQDKLIVNVSSEHLNTLKEELGERINETN